MFSSRTIGHALVVLPLLLSSAFADTLVFDRGLPTANLNDGAGANRSNISWGIPGNQEFTGDTFTLAGSQGVSKYVINTLRIWTAEGSNLNFDFSSLYTSLRLYGGPAGSTLSMLESGDFTGGAALNNPNIVITPVVYANGTGYEGAAGALYQPWQVDFTNLNWEVDAGTLMYFGILGLTKDPDYYWVNHASNAALSGSTQQGADDLYLGFDTSNPGAVQVFDSNGLGWDKSSDINVQIFADAIVNPVPEPASLLLFGTALGAILMVLRKKRA